jgi:Lipocalin-like domain
VTRRLFVVGVTVLSLAGVSVVGQSKPSIQGVWKVTEVTTTGPNAVTNKSPQPGLYIFTAKHYSIVRDTARTPRPAIKDPLKVTPDEALATFNSFQAQAGTYEVTSTTLKATPVVAKNPPPAGQRYGATITWTMQLSGDTLTLKQVMAISGKPPANPAMIRLTRVE